jgi:hypothetical protein
MSNVNMRSKRDESRATPPFSASLVVHYDAGAAPTARARVRRTQPISYGPRVLLAPNTKHVTVARAARASRYFGACELRRRGLADRKPKGRRGIESRLAAQAMEGAAAEGAAAERLLVVTVPEGVGPGELLLVTDESTGLEYNVTVPAGVAAGEEIEVAVDEDAQGGGGGGDDGQEEARAAELTLSPTAARVPGTPEQSPAEEATPPSPEPNSGASSSTAAAATADALHLSPKRPPARPPPRRPCPSPPTEVAGGQTPDGSAKVVSQRSPLRGSPVLRGSPKHGSPVQGSPATPAAGRASGASPLHPATPQANTPSATEEATPPIPASPPPSKSGPVSEAAAPVPSKRSPPARKPPAKPATGSPAALSPSTPKRSPQVPLTPRPAKTPGGQQEVVEEATPPKQSEPTAQAAHVDEAAADGDALRLSAAEESQPQPRTSASGSSPAESPKRRPSRPPPVPDAARMAAGATPSPARVGASVSNTTSVGTVASPSPNRPRIPPKSPDVLKKAEHMRRMSKDDTDSDPSSPAMSSISEAGSGSASSGGRGGGSSTTPEPEPEPEPEPSAQAKAAAVAAAEAQASLKEFWIPVNEIKFGAPIDSGAFGTVYRGNYLGPVAVKSIRQQGGEQNSSTSVAISNGATAADADAASTAESERDESAAQQLLLSGRLVEEIRAQTRFHHQNVVQFLGLASGRPPHCPGAMHWLVVTELCDQNLFQVLHSGREIAWGTRFKLGLDIAQGMTYLHEKQHMAHLDLKSPNVLLKGKDAKLADFGSLRRLRAGPPRRRPPTKAAAVAAATAAAAANRGGAASNGSNGGGSNGGRVGGGQASADAEAAADSTTDHVVPRLLSFGGVGGMSDEQAAAMARVHAAVGSGGSPGGSGGGAAGGAGGGGDGGVEVAVQEMQQLGLSERDARQVAASLKSSATYGTYDGGSYAEQQGGIGTPEWLAPELLAVEAPGTPGRAASTRGVDWQAADRYSYGVILWELLTRKRPYEGYKGAAAVAKIGPTIVPVWAYEGQRPAWPSGGAAGGLLATPIAWRDLCDQCWDKEPTNRPAFKAIADSLRAMYPDAKANWPHPDKVQAAAAASERADRIAMDATDGGGGGSSATNSSSAQAPVEAAAAAAAAAATAAAETAQ